MKPPCERCGYIHTAADVVTVGRFALTGNQVFRANYDDSPLRFIRGPAEDDMCDWRARKKR